MQSYRLFKTVQFDEKCAQLTLFEKARVEAFLDQLTRDPSMIGKPLGVHFFREKKFNGKRLYYLVYGEWKAVLIVNISDKKEQALTIAKIRMALARYKEFVQGIPRDSGVI